MTEYKNFYENVKEANIRLKDTIVLYDGKPYYVLCMADHKSDGIIRIYLDDIRFPGGPAHQRIPGIPNEYPLEVLGDEMDKWLDKNPDKGIIRKQMDSPKFNKYRPFPLGMCNFQGQVVYMERGPTRYTQQGLMSSMITYSSIDINGSRTPVRMSQIPSFAGKEMSDTIVGEYPRPDLCLKNLQDPEIVNEGAGFNRSFALIRGPIDLMFLAYKSDVIGYMPDGDFSKVNISKKFRHTKEVVEELRLFDSIRITERI